uniref:Uncharacterized protein n=1 Tax=Musa acuminata subsp. malaccensis TaxID=214687 RepID=A0A804HMV9_MUSAM
KSEDAGGGPGKSYLFCLTAHAPWKRLSRRTECRPRPVVLITASGLQGEQPLAHGTM